MTLAALMAAISLVMPGPTPAPVIHEGQVCPGLASAACYYQHGDIYLSDPGNAFVRQHELGHAVDTLDLNDRDHAVIRASLGWRAWHTEAFADIYAGCRLGLDPAAWAFRIERIYHSVSRDRIPAACLTIAAASNATPVGVPRG